jgi:hypothetical protein
MTIPQRIARLTIGPPGQPGLTWGPPTNAADRPLYWEAEIEKTAASVPSKAKVEIYNLSPNSLKSLEGAGLVMQVVAGEGTPGELCYADIPRGGVKTRREGSDQITTIEAAEGQRIYREATISASYPPATTRTQILTDVVSAARLTRGHIDPTLPEVTYPAGMTAFGSVRDVLSSLYAPSEARWWLDGRTLHILAPDSALPGNAPVIASDTGMHGSPTRTDKGGIEVTCNLLPAITAGRPFVVRSRFASGSYRATKVQHKINSWGMTWETRLEGVPWQ